MNKVSGIGLLQNIKNGRLKDNSEIKVVFDDGINQRDVAIVIYKNDELIWQPGEFKVSMLYDDYYEFEIIEDNDKLEKINIKTGDDCKRFIEYDDETGHHKYTIRLLDEYFAKNINKMIDHINKIEEKLDER